MATGYDGSIKIDTKIDGKGFNAGMTKLRSSALGTMNAILFQFVRVGSGIRGVLDRIGSFGAMVFKKLLLGGLLLFALSAAKIFASLRESMNELINLRGGTLAKDVEDIKGQFTELRAAVANAFLPLLEIAIPYIKLALDWLLQLFNKLAMITAAFAGQKEVLQITAGSAAKLAKETEKTKKAAQNALAAFDQINVLQQPKADESPATFAAEMVPVTNNILSRVQQIKDAIAAWWDNPIDMIKNTWSAIKDWFKANVIDPIARWWMDTWIHQNIFAPMLGLFLQVWEDAKLGAQVAWDLIVLYAGAAWIKIQEIWGNIAKDAGKAWEQIKTIWANFKAWFTDNIFTPLRSGFGTALDWVSQKWHEIFTKISDFVRSKINGILALIDSMVQSILTGINTVLEAIATVTGVNATVPSIGVSTNIPHLATGAVIPPNSSFLAVLGDQKSGTNIEAPADLIRQIIREELGGAGGGGTIDVTLNLDGEVIYKNQQRVSTRHGKSLISGSAA